jgi:subtilisin family serine protease
MLSRHARASLVLGAALALTACADGPTMLNNTARPPEDDALIRADDDTSGFHGDIIPGQYIVTMRTGFAASALSAVRLSRSATGDVSNIAAEQIAAEQIAAPGSSVTLDLAPSEAADLALDPRVLAVEPDRVVHVATVQTAPRNWGLDRLDQVALPLSNSFNYSQTGAGVTAYIIDTGLLPTHNEYTGRASIGLDLLPTISPGKTDCSGHGSRMAGILGGTTTGVAKGVKLVGIRVMDCKGTGSVTNIIAAVDWVVKNGKKPAVISMSVGSGVSVALDQAVTRAKVAGFAVFAAAMNNNADACLYSPARAADAITVGATDKTDTRASFSNFGKCVSIFAPGTDIISAWYTGNAVYSIGSGTSDATPEVAGAAVLYLQKYPTATPAQVKTALATSLATVKIVKNAGTGNLAGLLYFPSVLPSIAAPK